MEKERFSDYTARLLVDSAACVRQECPWLAVVAARPGKRVLVAALTPAVLRTTINTPYTIRTQPDPTSGLRTQVRRWAVEDAGAPESSD